MTSNFKYFWSGNFVKTPTPCWKQFEIHIIKVKSKTLMTKSFRHVVRIVIVFLNHCSVLVEKLFI